MRKYSADNRMLLRERYPDIYGLLRDRAYNGNRYFLETTKDNELNIGLQINGAEVRMYSKYSPLNEAASWASAAMEEIGDTEHILVYGFGLGYHLEALLRVCTAKRIYVYEPDLSVFQSAVDNRDLRKILDNKQIMMLGVGNDHSMQIEYQRVVMKRITDSFKTLITPPYKRLFGEEVKEFIKSFEKTTADFRSVLATVSHFQIGWARNIILNLEKNLRTPSIRGLMNSCASIPAVIVGSGPSLEHDLGSLKILKGRALVIAAGTSALGLINNGVIPDLIVSMDPGEHNQVAFTKVDVSDIPFLYIPTIHHAILNQKLRLMHAYYHTDFMSAFLMQLTDEDPVFQSSSSVSGTALQVAAYLGCSEIILVGHDLSFPNNRYYASGITHAGEKWEKERLDASDLSVLNVSGGMNRTDNAMKGLKYGIEEIIRILPDATVYNASQIGAVIESTLPIDLKQYAATVEKPPMQQEWFKELMREQAKSYSEGRKKVIVQHIQRTHEKVDSMHSSFELLGRHVERYVKEWNDQKKTQWLNHFDSLWLPIVEEDVFKHVHSFLLQREVNYLERYWEQIVNERSVSQKIQILIRALHPLLIAYTKIAPVIRNNFDYLERRLRASKLLYGLGDQKV